MSSANGVRSIVLIVDDDESVRFLMIQMLSMICDIECVGASNSREALVMIKDHHVDAMILDSLLDRERGMDVYLEALSIDPNLKGKVLFTSGQPPAADNWAFFENNDLKFLMKPFSLDDFIRSVRCILEPPD